jgi:hypothetical protein
VAVRLHYSRGGRQVSLCRPGVLFMRRTVLGVLGLAAVFPAFAQYPGQIAKTDKNAPVLRSIAVLEWTGKAGKPKNSRLVPVCVFDGTDLQDGGVYLARPQPLAVDGGTEYVLQKDGKRIGLFDVNGAGQVEGSWVGFGNWKAMPHPVVKKSQPTLAQNTIDDEGGDRPVLHRKHHAGDAQTGGTDNGSGSSSPAPPVDPDRPTLHKESSTQDSSEAAADPDRPTLKKTKASKSLDAGYVEDLPNVTDPDRPRLLRGKPADSGSVETPTLMGMPPDMEQTVAVSDASNRPEHPWSYSWANPADELKMKADLEDVARTALGLNAPPPAPAPVSKRAGTRKKAAKPTPPPPPAPLEDEQFRVFELAYGSGATLVLTAHTAGPLAEEKFVTLIAQPDLYGSLLVLFKNVTDGSHLDEKPRMRLVDAVDAMADNRGALLFELRGMNRRQFALYRVLRGSAEKLFVTGGGYYGSPDAN